MHKGLQDNQTQKIIIMFMKCMYVNSCECMKHLNVWCWKKEVWSQSKERLSKSDAPVQMLPVWASCMANKIQVGGLSGWKMWTKQLLLTCSLPALHSVNCMEQQEGGYGGISSIKYLQDLKVGWQTKHNIQLERGLDVPNSTENHHFDVSLDFAKRTVISTSKQGFRNSCLYAAFCWSHT